jgi:phage gpG-like protein
MSSVSVNIKWDNTKIASIEYQAKRGLVRMGYDIANQARRNAPYKTGALSNSIRVEENGDEIEVLAGGNYGGKSIKYAAIQEFGGYAGRNHSAHIVGKHYMERAKDYIMTGNYLQKYFGDIL